MLYVIQISTYDNDVPHYFRSIQNERLDYTYDIDDACVFDSNPDNKSNFSNLLAKLDGPLGIFLDTHISNIKVVEYLRPHRGIPFKIGGEPRGFNDH